MAEKSERLERERSTLLRQLENGLEVPLAVLGLVWLALVAVELARGDSSLLTRLGTAIWVVFIADFVLKLTLAPRKGAFLRRNWFVLLSLVLPALRILRLSRALRLLRLTRGMRLLRLLSSINRGLRSLRHTLRRRGVGYVCAATVLITFAGAAGIMALEADGAAAESFSTYGDALWWTAMMMTTMGSETWPRTAEGRALSFVLALYAFVVFGYLTASLASHFIEQDAKRVAGPRPGSP